MATIELATPSLLAAGRPADDQRGQHVDGLLILPVGHDHRLDPFHDKPARRRVAPCPAYSGQRRTGPGPDSGKIILDGAHLTPHPTGAPAPRRRTPLNHPNARSCP
jgi:hypothetical protein